MLPFYLAVRDVVIPSSIVHSNISDIYNMQVYSVDLSVLDHALCLENEIKWYWILELASQNPPNVSITEDSNDDGSLNFD